MKVTVDPPKRQTSTATPAKPGDLSLEFRDAIKATNYKSIVGAIDFSKGPFPNCAETPLVIEQWRKGTKYPHELVIVDNTTAPEVPVGGEPSVIKYS